jgi:hypothetical protein
LLRNLSVTGFGLEARGPFGEGNDVGSLPRPVTAITEARTMAWTWFLLVLAFLPGLTSVPVRMATPQAAERTKREKLLEIYTNDAARYAIFRDAERKERLELQREPVYVWTNPLREGGQDGVVFVWTCRGRAEALGSIFSFPAMGPRNLYHEFHSLSLSVLDVSRPGSDTWTPEAAGIELMPIFGAPAPASLALQRMAQMRELAREFTASTEDDKNRSWQLRLLPRPLYRYESTDPDVLDGALFGFVTSAGTDPEALLILEARRPAPDRDPVWHYAVARFTDLNLWVRHKGNEVFAAPLIAPNLPRQDPKHRYRLIRDRILPSVDDPAQ